MDAPAESFNVADAFSVRDQVVIVTGAAGRIGGVIARAFAANGARVIVSDRKVDWLEAFAEELRAEASAEVVARPADLRVPAELRALVDAAGTRFGRLDTLVHCGAIIASKPLRDEPDDAFELLFETNVRSTFLLAKYAAPLLEESAGSMINLSSVNGHRALFPCPLYSASKAAVMNMTAAFAAELGEKRVRFNTVSPGLIADGGGFVEHLARQLHARHVDTFLAMFGEEFRQQVSTSQPLPIRGAGYDVAMACLYLASPAARFVTGADLLVDGGKLHMFEEQQRRGGGGKEFWGRVREHLRSLPEEAWKGPKPEWLTKK